MSAAENKVLVRRMLIDAFTTADPRALAEELVTADWVNIDPSLPPFPPGPEGAAQLLALFRDAFSDLEMRLDAVIAEDAGAAGSFTFKGTHTGEFMGIPPTGKWVEATGTGMFRIVGGKIAENRVNFDALGLLQQLGVVPTPERPPR